MRKPTPLKLIEPKIQTRLDALERLIDSEYGGMPSVFELKTGVKMAQVNQWFSGYRALRDKALKNLIEKTGVKDDYFDTPVLSPEEAQLQTMTLQIMTLLKALPKSQRDVEYRNFYTRLAELTTKNQLELLEQQGVLDGATKR
jgi:hypothetical protein